LVYGALGDVKKAETEFLQACDLSEEACDIEPEVPAFRMCLGTCLNNLADLYSKYTVAPAWGVKAGEAYRRSITVFETLVQRHPDMPDYARRLASSRNDYANLLAKKNQSDKAEPLFVAARMGFKKLVLNYPDIPLYRTDLGLCLNSLGLLYK